MAEGRAGGLGRGGRVLLYLSLAVNLLVVGLVVGALVSGGDKLRDRRPPAAGEGGFGPVFSALEPEDRRVLGREMRQILQTERRDRREMRALMTEFVTVLASDPFDEAAFDALLDVQFGEATFRLGLARDVFEARVQEMSVAERQALSERLAAELEKRAARGPRGAPDQGE